MSDALHIEGELVGRFAIDRKGLPAVALAGPAGLTATANDYSYDDVFARLFEAHHRPGDVAVGLSTSGNSENVVRALAKARALGAGTIALTGTGGGRCAELADVCIAVPSTNTPRIQELHITVGHLLCDVVERALFGSP
jgi:D-sedoheptulose 7-phosphate isomerase